MVKYLPRRAEAEVERWVKRGKSVVLVGPRQAGKTTLLKHLAEKHGWTYLTLDDAEARSMLENVKDFARMFEGDIILLDEGQYDEEIGKKLKYLYDVEGKLFVVSGSGSFDVKVKVSGELVGRAARVVLLPLDFLEFVTWKARKDVDLYRECREAVYNILAGKDDEPPVEHIPSIATLWREYVVFGGYPEVVLEKDYHVKEERIEQILSAYIDRDILGFLGVREYEKFRRVMEYLARIVSTPLGKSALARFAGASYQTVEGYISLLMLTYVIFPVYALPLFASSIRKAPKMYFYDMGVRNELVGDFRLYSQRLDQGALLENFVARHLHQHFGKVYYHRTKVGGEVDFVVGHVPVEVKTSGRTTRSLSNVAERLEAPHKVVVHEAPFKREGDTYYIPPWFF